MAHWFAQMKGVADLKYAEQMAFLRETHGFSRAHANALVLYSRGSKTSRRYETIDGYFAQFDAAQVKTARGVLRAAMSASPALELAIAWNKPMVRLGARYVFGVAVFRKHILVSPWSADVLTAFADRFDGCKLNKKTIGVPLDWKVDKVLIREMVEARMSEPH